jgi:tetrapyrrole methylase family protein/MazG family protein
LKNNLNEQTGTNFDKLVQLVEILRSEDGCDWDKAQTNDSLIPYFIEEVYELIDSIDKKDSKNTKEELGDVMLHLVFQTQISNEKGLYTINDVLENINKKLVERHPHVFNQASHSTFAKVNWESQKHLEKKRKSRLDGVPSILPSVIFSQRIQEKAALAGFDWDNIEDVWLKINEEISELKIAQNENDFDNIHEEIGDLLFTLINLSRHLGISADNALRKSNKKFIRRFQLLENEINDLNKTIEECSAEDLNKLWEKIKDN